ncbi:hypothetical protein CARN8_1970001 [mine drainage metagenome]|uniref:Uncharacterized protein n=1 Tax=mine drainage metagenome TaxID=410659 RepID=A0A3P3ZMK7_9ZZZZ
MLPLTHQKAGLKFLHIPSCMVIQPLLNSKLALLPAECHTKFPMAMVVLNLGMSASVWGFSWVIPRTEQK